MWSPAAQTAAPAQAGGRGAGVIYVDTEGAFTADRLVEVAQARFPDLAADPAGINATAVRVRIVLADTSACLMATCVDEDVDATQAVDAVMSATTPCTTIPCSRPHPLHCVSLAGCSASRST